MPLLTLAAELLLLIGENLPFSPLNSLSQTCTRLHTLLTPLLYQSAVQTEDRRFAMILRKCILTNQLTSLSRLLDTASVRDVPLPMILQAAATTGNTAAVRMLLEHGVPTMQGVNQCWDSALHIAASGGDVEMVGVLLDHGAEINSSDWYGNPPLVRACQSGENCAMAIIRMLLLRGAATEMGEVTVLEKVRDKEVAGLLLEFGASARRVDLLKWVGSYEGVEDLGLLKRLVERGATVQWPASSVEFWRELEKEVMEIEGWGEVEEILKSVEVEIRN